VYLIGLDFAIMQSVIGYLSIYFVAYSIHRKLLNGNYRSE